MASGHAQESRFHYDQSLEIWASPGFKYKVNKDLDIGISQALRTNATRGGLKQIFTDIQGDYEVGKRWEIGAGLRWFQYDNPRNYRWQTDLSYDPKKVDRFSFGVRLRYQQYYEWGKEVERTARVKGKVEYNLKGVKIDPFITAEGFFGIEPGQSMWDTYRVSAGADWRYDKQQTISLEFRLEQKINVAFPGQIGIISIDWVYKMERDD